MGETMTREVPQGESESLRERKAELKKELADLHVGFQEIGRRMDELGDKIDGLILESEEAEEQAQSEDAEGDAEVVDEAA